MEFLINVINKITAQEIPNITSPLNPIKVYVKPNEDCATKLPIKTKESRLIFKFVFFAIEYF